MEEEIKKVLTPREELKKLESEGKYVFHGSRHKLDQLEPRQGQDMNRGTGLMENDGRPAISATPSADIAIFRSLISSSRGRELGERHASAFYFKDGRDFFAASESAFVNAYKPDTVGYVHVFSKGQFEVYNEREVRSYTSIKPLQVIEVKGKDLPENITVIPDDKLKVWYNTFTSQGSSDG